MERLGNWFTPNKWLSYSGILGIKRIWNTNKCRDKRNGNISLFGLQLYTFTGTIEILK